MAAKGVMAMAKCLLVTFLIYLPILCSSGTLVGFSYDARKERDIDAAVFSFIERNNIPPSQFRIFASNHGALLDSLSNTGISVDLLLSHSQAKTLLKSRFPNHLPLAKVTSIVLAGLSKMDLFSLLPTLNTIQSTLKNSDVRISAMFSLPCLESLNKSEKKEMRRILWFIQEVQSFIVVETQVDGELSMGDAFVDHVFQRAVTACKTLHHPAIPLVLNVRSSVVPSGVEISEFSERVMDAIEKHSEIKKRISAIFVEILPIAEDVQKSLSWEKEMIFPSSHRQLFNYEVHDAVTPVTNPATTSPITVPSTNPSPGVITVPATNPVTVLPTNPTTPITVPSTNPDVTPVTAPGMNPLPTPITNTPLAPVTNPVTSPTTVPVTSPVTNPVTTYPPAGGVPSTTPVTNPGTDPVSPAVSGQSWCVAKSGSLDSALQAALDYACGIGGADCSVIQVSGSCYNPNSLQAHASYAFNSYYQKNPVPTSCDFDGTATLVNINPSTGTCVYPSSSLTSGVNPASTFGGATGTGTGAGTSTGTGAGVGFIPGAGIGAVPGPGSVLNTNNSAGSSTVFGSDTPTGSNGHSIHHPVCWTLFLSVVATACITGNIC
ncbi:putative carbohydrate-binding X8 domain-containing protein, plant [Dioscorea sansibarensis]